MTTPWSERKDLTAVVTGCNVGLGKASVELMAKSGRMNTIVMACRNPTLAREAMIDIAHNIDGQEADTKVNTKQIGDDEYETLALADGTQLLSMKLDLSAFASIESFVNNFKALGMPLHVLVCNAGLSSNLGRRTAEGFRLVYGVNFIGHVYLVDLLLDNLKASKPSRIVHTASVMHRVGRTDITNVAFKGDSGACYRSSKLSQVMYSNELHRRHYVQDGVSSIAISPGAVDSSIWREVQGNVEKVFGAVRRCIFLNTYQGAAPIVHAALMHDDEKPTAELETKEATGRVLYPVDTPLAQARKHQHFYTPYWIPDTYPFCNLFCWIAPFAGAQYTLSTSTSRDPKACLKLYNTAHELIDDANSKRTQD
jgi:NAD(P)-dependent dehydrogenase (short-subunit alcohol dehydrogenase family)